MLGIAYDSGNFEKYSTTTTIINFLYPVVFGKSPNISISRWENGQGLEMLICCVASVLIPLLNL